MQGKYQLQSKGFLKDEKSQESYYQKLAAMRTMLTDSLRKILCFARMAKHRCGSLMNQVRSLHPLSIRQPMNIFRRLRIVAVAASAIVFIFQTRAATLAS